jgi:DNA-binding beta-propeller fold protein YncE
MTARTIAALGLVVCLGGASVLAPAGVLAGGVKGKIVSVNHDGNSVTVIDQLKKSVLDDPQVGSHPIKAMADAQGSSLYVINSGSDDMSVVNLDKFSVTTIPLGFQPSDLEITPSGTTVVILHEEPDVASGGNEFKGDYSIYDVKQQAVVRTNRLKGLGEGDQEPCGIVTDGSNDMMWITSCAASKVVLIDLRKARENDSGDEVRAVLDIGPGPVQILRTSR